MSDQNKAILEKFVRVTGLRGPAGVKRLEEAVLRTGDLPDGLVFRGEDANFIRGLAAECGTTPGKLMGMIMEYSFTELMKWIHLVPVELVNRDFRAMMRKRGRLLRKAVGA